MHVQRKWSQHGLDFGNLDRVSRGNGELKRQRGSSKEGLHCAGWLGLGANNLWIRTSDTHLG